MNFLSRRIGSCGGRQWFIFPNSQNRSAKFTNSMLLLILFSSLDWQQLFPLFYFTPWLHNFPIKMDLFVCCEVLSWFGRWQQEGALSLHSEGKEEIFFSLCFIFHCPFYLIILAKIVCRHNSGKNKVLMIAGYSDKANLHLFEKLPWDFFALFQTQSHRVLWPCWSIKQSKLNLK